MTKSLNQAFIKAYSKEERLAQQATASKQPEPAVEDSYIVRFDTATVSVTPPHQPKTPSRNPTKRPTATQSQRLPASAGQSNPVPPRPESTGIVPAPKLQSAAPAVSVRHAEVIYSGDVNSNEQQTTPQPAAQPADPMQTLRESIASQMVQAGSWEFPTMEPESTPPTKRVDQEHSIPSPASQVVPVAPQQPAIQQAVANSTIQPAHAPEAATPYAAQPAQPQPVAPQPPPMQPTASQPKPQAGTTYREHAPVQHHDATTAQAAPVQYRVDPVEATATAETTSTPRSQTTGAPPQLQPLAEPALPQHSERHEKDGEIFRLDRPTYDPTIDGEDSGEVSAASESASITSVDPLAEVSEAERGAARAEASQRAAQAEQELRAAKKRIFNPVWEVDNFHWPDVCLDLLQQSGEQMDAVAENLSSACEEGLQVLAVTSPEGGEGRTTIACCLAMLAGSRGLNVAIVDADLEHPTLALQTNLELDQDWRSAVQHQIPLEEIAVHSIDDQVTLVPLVAPVEHAEISTDDNRIASMFQELSESFDLVIADMGPMSSPRSLVSTMGEHGIISAVVSVVNRQETAAEQIEACIRRVRQSGIVSIGLVENFVS